MLRFGQILNRDIATLLSLEVLQGVLVPLLPLVTTTNNVDSIVDGVAHRALVSDTATCNVDVGM